MRKILTFLTIFIFVVAGAVFLTGTGQEMSRADVCVGPDIVTIDVSSEKSGVTLVDQDRNGLTVRVDVGCIHFVPVATIEGSYILPRIDGFSRSFEIGYPTLPVAAKLVSIPFDCKLKTEVLDFTTQDIDLEAYGLVDPFMPVQPPLSKSENPALMSFVRDGNVYKAGGKYTLPLVSTEILGTMRALHLAKIAISPVEYYPTENKITVFTSVTVRVKYQNPNWAKTDSLKKNYGSPYFDVVNRQILNYESGAREADLVKYPIKYAIVSDRMFEPQLQPFIQWKTKKGFKVEVGYTDVIGFTTTAIKSWIEGLYNAGTAEDPAPSFVLLVGDVQQVPAFPGSTGAHITDIRYCEFTGDYFPEIYYGRFSAQHTTELQPQIDKTLEYEQYTMPDPGYLGEVTLVAGVDPYYAYAFNGQINYGTNYYFNAAHGISPHVWLYPDSEQPGTPAAIVQTVSDGVGLYNYIGHCGHYGPVDPYFTPTNIGSLINFHKYLLGIGNCCQSNTFGSDFSTPCFGEEWLQADDKGGIGWIGASGDTYLDEDHWWAVGNGPITSTGPTYQESGIGAYDGVFHDHGEPVTLHYTTNAAIIFAGNMAVTEAGSSRTEYYWEVYHLMGDPSVMTYMGVPSANNISHTNSVITTATSINVQADPGSYVGVSRSGVIHGAGYIGDTGSADITLTPFGAAGTADIVVTCQNRVPYVSTIAITGPTDPPIAEFVASPTSGMVPVTVDFTDQSIGENSWSWDFGDTGTSTEQDPTHTYTSIGTYTVTLTVTNAYGTDTETKTNYITVTALQPPVADFTAGLTTIEAGQDIAFTDQSTNNPTSWSWTFDGGTPSGSSDQNPTVTYNTPGTYTVSLTVSNAAGSDAETKTGYITVTEPPLVYCESRGNEYRYEWIARVEVGLLNNPSGQAGYTDFTSITTDLTAGDTVNVSLTNGFSGAPGSEYWKIWIDYNIDGDFEDAGEEVFAGVSTSTVTGSFMVPTSADGVTRMRVAMKAGSEPTPCEIFSNGEVEDYTVDIGDGTIQPPTADFTANKTTVMEGGSINFTDLSSDNPTSWSWTFAGGIPSTAAGENPTVTYNTPGTYDVTLTVSNSAGSDTETKVDYITVTVLQPPVAEFFGSRTTVEEGQSVSFADLSTNSPTSWSWTFDGGTPSTSTEQNQIVIYNTAGTYTVTLTAANSSGSDTETKYNYITVQPPSTCIGVITNPGFETGTSGWTEIGSVSITGDSHSGSNAVSIDGANSAVQQVITGLCGSTTYTVSCWGKAKDAAGVYLGVKNYGGAEQTVKFTDFKKFVQQSITFTTGASNSSATIFFSKTNKKFTGLADDFEIVKN